MSSARIDSIIVTESGIVASKRVLPKREAAMTQASIREYVEAVRGRYYRASKKEKGMILDEFTKVMDLRRIELASIIDQRQGLVESPGFTFPP